MARNWQPEETVNLILDVAFHLFMEKGDEHTSVQDIINNLGGLSKDAIYHHFKSKEDILVVVTDRMTAESNQILAANVWMNPMIFDSTEEESYHKFMVFKQMLQGFGLDIIDSEMLERLQKLASIYQKNKQ